MCPMDDLVEDGIGDGVLPDDLVSAGHRQLGGYEGRLSSMPVHNYLHEVHPDRQGG